MTAPRTDALTNAPTDAPLYASAFDRLAVWAARYALGRSTYAVGDVCDVLTAYRSWLSPQTRAQIIDDITHAEERHDTGMEMDRLRWLSLRDILR